MQRLSQYILQVTNEPVLGCDFAAAMAATFPSFRDSVSLGGAVIELNCKALSLVDELHQRFGSERYTMTFADHSTLTAGANFSLLSILFHLRLIELVESAPADFQGPNEHVLDGPVRVFESFMHLTRILLQSTS